MKDISVKVDKTDIPPFRGVFSVHSKDTTAVLGQEGLPILGSQAIKFASLNSPDTTSAFWQGGQAGLPIFGQSSALMGEQVLTPLQSPDFTGFTLSHLLQDFLVISSLHTHFCDLDLTHAFTSH